jgi:hypothetical protein
MLRDAAEEIQHRGDDDQRKKPPVPGPVEEVTGHEQHPVLELVAQDQIEAVDDEEE